MTINLIVRAENEKEAKKLIKQHIKNKITLLTESMVIGSMNLEEDILQYCSIKCLGTDDNDKLYKKAVSSSYSMVDDDDNTPTIPDTPKAKRR